MISTLLVGSILRMRMRDPFHVRRVYTSFAAWHHGMLVKTYRWPPVAKKMVLQLIIVSLLSSLTQSVSSSRVHETIPGTLCVQNVTFLHLIPCWRALEIDGIHKRRSAALDRLNSCDLLARAAVELAIERVNENQNDIFGCGSRYVRTVPLFPETNDTITVSSIEATILKIEACYKLAQHDIV